jgi:hypothetical protein
LQYEDNEELVADAEEAVKKLKELTLNLTNMAEDARSQQPKVYPGPAKSPSAIPGESTLFLYLDAGV